MAEQARAIAGASHRPGVRIGVIPWTTPVAQFPRGGFHLYDDAAVHVATDVATAIITAPPTSPATSSYPPDSRKHQPLRQGDTLAN